ncbi:MAG: hypothetical protein FWG63_02365 [Defluviitaleaceae bacterium]|nr:hypothetical protein [Defluviitaleaceae bacterium]
MREYFRNTLFAGNISPRLSYNPISYCCDFVVGSRAGIGDKLAALRKLPSCKETTDLINTAEFALSERASVKDNVFLVSLHFPIDVADKNSNAWYERVPFLTYESAIKWIHKETKKNCELYSETLEQCANRIWYEVEKFVPDENGELELKITWTLNAQAEIMFFEIDYAYDKKYKISGCVDDEDSDSLAWFHWEGNEELAYVPVPFDFGDIITIDMRPFYEEYRAVVVRLGDNCDCCSVACIYCDEDGFLHCSTLKHNLSGTLTKVSPLYRAEVFKGDLPENEKVLAIISEAIKKIPSTEKTEKDGSIWRNHELADKFDDFFYSHNYKRHKDSIGCSWDEFKEQFGL